MSDQNFITDGTRRALAGVAADLHAHYRGTFGEPTVLDVVTDSYWTLAATATTTRWLIVGAERFARQRLDALVHAQTPSYGRPPAVLFLCVHNAGRSQMALGFFHHRAGERASAWSGGSEPADAINPAAVAAMAEVGIDIAQEFPKRWTDEFVDAADVVVTMGCGDSCPLVPGKRYEDWDIEDPAGKTVEQIRPIRDDIARHVDQLLEHLDVPAPVTADDQARRLAT